MNLSDGVRVKVELTKVYLSRQPGDIIEFSLAIAQKLIDAKMAVEAPKGAKVTPHERKRWEQDTPGDDRIAELEAQAARAGELEKRLAALEDATAKQQEKAKAA